MNTPYWSGACRLLLLVGLHCVPLAAHSEPVTLTLGTGHLGAGAFGLFNFTLAHNVGAGDVLQVSTTGSNFDTEIAIYNTVGRLVATNDDVGPRNHLSQLIFGTGKTLAAGDYTVALSGFNTIFRDNDIVPGSSQGGGFQLNIQTTQPVLLPSQQSYLAKDGNLLPNAIQETELASGWLESHSVQRIDFTLEDNILRGDWLAIHTYGSGFDTEIGLYNSRGKLIATNDDFQSGNLLSRISFGLDGDNGRNLLAGAYTLLLGGFNTHFRNNLVASSSLDHGGDFSVYVQTSAGISIAHQDPPPTPRAISEPSAISLMGLGLVLLLRLRR